MASTHTINGKVYYTGHVRAPHKDHLIQLSHQRHALHLQALKVIDPPPSFDCRTYGWVGPIKDQGQCGSCWDFSGTCVSESAFYKAGVLKPDGSQCLSEQYTLDCGKNGGCNGDDNVTVLEWAKATGLPQTSQYGSYEASSDRCKYNSNETLYLLDDWGFADPSGQQGEGVTPVLDIKSAMQAHGVIGCGVDAGFQDPGTGIISGGGCSIDHDVALVGWNDTASKTTVSFWGGRSYTSKIATDGYWIMRNSWGTSWADQGYAKIKWGAYCIGTESVWATKKGLPPPPWFV